MIDARVTFLENQLDEMAGRMARLEDDLRGLKQLLVRPRLNDLA